MRTFIHLLAIFLLPTLLYGQDNLIFKGKVTDALTHEPLADSHVYVSSQQSGVVTDVNGNYQIEVPRSCMTQCLIVSYMGYEKFIIPIHNIAQSEFDIELDYGTIVLAELVITPDYYQVIYHSESDPFNSEPIISDMFFETVYNGQTERLITMY